jgi:CheY-like chemotaxis protein
MSPLEGKRILLVEDEFIVAAMAADMLTELGATVIGPANTIAKALDLAKTCVIDAAVLDVNMNGDRIDPVAELLRAGRVPMVFATGYGACPFESAHEVPILDKPYTQEQLATALVRALLQKASARG